MFLMEMQIYFLVRFWGGGWAWAFALAVGWAKLNVVQMRWICV